MSKKNLDNNDALGSRIKSQEFKNRIVFAPKSYIVEERNELKTLLINNEYVKKIN